MQHKQEYLFVDSSSLELMLEIEDTAQIKALSMDALVSVSIQVSLLNERSYIKQ